MNYLKLSLPLILLLFFTGCIPEDKEVQLTVKPANNGASPDSSGDSGSGDSGPGDSGSGDSGSGDSGPGDSGASSSPTLIFSEDFETGSIDSSKWSTYRSSTSVNPQITTNSGSLAWRATSSFSLWDASIITQNTFNLPITVEWDQHIISSYSNSLLREGLCIYSTLLTRSSHHYSPESGNDFGCIYIKYNPSRDGNRPVLIPYGLFHDSANPHPDLGNYHDGSIFGGVRLANLFLNYRITVSISSDLSYTVTIQFKDGSGAAPYIYQDSLTATAENFHLEFNNADRDTNHTFYDDIKVYDEVREPTPID